MSKRAMRGQLEQRLRRRYPILAGVDEVGRGCIAGPVFAAVVVLDYAKLRALPVKTRDLIRDSKTLSSRQRGQMLPILARIARASAIAHAGVDEIESSGIVGATFTAMNRALAQIPLPIAMLLVDGNRPLPAYTAPQTTIIKGDFYCYCIAAASIMAKEARDRYMTDLAPEFPAYGFDQHVGYGTKQHLAAIKDHGICVLHRRNFAPISQIAPL